MIKCPRNSNACTKILSNTLPKQADTIPLNEEERKQWEEDDGEYISLEDVKKKLGF